MKISDWSIFEWNLNGIQAKDRPKLPPFVFRQATPDDRTTVEKVLRSAISQEPAISTKINSPILPVEEACDIAFQSSVCSCVVVQHGSRIIGASALHASPEATNHLLTGPSILHEYWNRGIGSALLFNSLEFLKDVGLARATGCARANSVAARFVYPKFGSVSSLPMIKPLESTPEMAGA